MTEPSSVEPPRSPIDRRVVAGAVVAFALTLVVAVAVHPWTLGNRPARSGAATVGGPGTTDASTTVVSTSLPTTTRPASVEPPTSAESALVAGLPTAAEVGRLTKGADSTWSIGVLHGDRHGGGTAPAAGCLPPDQPLPVHWVYRLDIHQGPGGSVRGYDSLWVQEFADPAAAQRALDDRRAPSWAACGLQVEISDVARLLKVEPDPSASATGPLPAVAGGVAVQEAVPYLDPGVGSCVAWTNNYVAAAGRYLVKLSFTTCGKAWDPAITAEIVASSVARLQPASP